MAWSDQYPQGQQPTYGDMETYISSTHWEALNSFLRTAYQTEPKMAYSRCSAQPGWNIKYQKSGKSLCTLYPMEGYFIALVVIGEKEKAETELLLPALSDHTRLTYAQAGDAMGARWLMLSVTSRQVLEDVKALIALRVKPKIAI